MFEYHNTDIFHIYGISRLNQNLKKNAMFRQIVYVLKMSVVLTRSDFFSIGSQSEDGSGSLSALRQTKSDIMFDLLEEHTWYISSGRVVILDWALTGTTCRDELHTKHK